MEILSIQKASECSFSIDDETQPMAIHGGLIYWMLADYEHGFSLSVNTTVQWGRYKGSTFSSCKLNVDAPLREVIETCENEARQFLKKAHPGIVLKSSFYKDGWDVREDAKYDGPALSGLKPRERVKAVVRCGGVWVDPAKKAAKMRWLLTELRRVQG